MSWWLMHEKNRKDAKMQELKSFFRRLERDFSKLYNQTILHVSVDKDDDDEITKDDWYQALQTTGAKVTM